MERDEPGPSRVRVVTRKHLFEKMQQQTLPTFDLKLEYVEKYILSLENYSEDEIKEVKHKFSHMKTEFKQKWIAAHRKADIFVKTNQDWLEKTFELPTTAHRTGRPSIPFEKSSERSKRRKTEMLRSTDENTLTYAAQIKLRTSGKRGASRILKEITTSPGRAGKYRTAYAKAQKFKKLQLSPLRALAMFVEADLTRRQYEIIRSSKKEVYPCYSVLQKEKRQCYPPKESYKVSETSAEITLQELLNHTTTRLLTYLEDVLGNVNNDERNTLKLICKWGCDGSRQEQFKQKMQSDSDDSSIFQSSFVPLKIIYGKKGEKMLWQNPTPSSPRYCRPIRIRFVKETVSTTNEEITYVEDAIKSLQPTEVILGECYHVQHTMLLTMVDTKVCNSATQTTSTMKCYICGATSKDFNNLEKKKDLNTDSLRFGLSVLHARIRLFESLLHLSYKLPVRKWKLKLEHEKALVKQKKADIQQKFRQQTGLIVDVPKAGFGNSNDGNTSRRFFADPKVAAEITGIDFNLIYRFKVILEVISSGHKINIEKFAEYGYATAELYIELYPWYPMTPTVHKILIHGADVVKNAILPIGQLSEEAAEARNKHFRLYRQNFARKFSRETCNMDILNRLLLTSDPLLTSMRPTPRKKTKPFLKESIELLLPADPTPTKSGTDSEDTSDEDFSSGEEPWLSSSS